MSKKSPNLSPSRSARRLQKSIPLRLIDEVTPAFALPIANSLRLRFTLGPLYMDSFFIFLPVNASQACRQLTPCGFVVSYTLTTLSVTRTVFGTRAIYVIMWTGHGVTFLMLRWKFYLFQDRFGVCRQFRGSAQTDGQTSWDIRQQSWWRLVTEK